MTGRAYQETSTILAANGGRPHLVPVVTPPTKVAFERTDLGNAELFAALYSSGLRYIKEQKMWLENQTTGLWSRDATGAAERAAKDVARGRLRAAAELVDGDEQKAEIRWAMQSQSDSKIRAMLSLATTEPGIVLRAADLDTDPYLLACRNGVIDLRTAVLRKAQPQDLISLGSDVPYDPDALCPRWEQFLDQVFDGNAELVRYVQRFVGYCLTGDTREHKLLLLHGSGCNGKSTFVEIVQRLIGDQATTSAFDSFARVRNDRPVRNDLARLHRSRLVVASESGEGRRLDEAIVKTLTGGDTIATRFLYGEHFEFKPQFKLWLVTNYLPRVDGGDEAMWRRIRKVPFEVSFEGREDRTLSDQLDRELPGILNWALDGCLSWQIHGLEPEPDAVKTATTAYRAEEDLLGSFIDQRCNLTGEIEPADLRSALDHYCQEMGERPPSASVLGRRLGTRGIKRSSGNHGPYIGLSLQ